VQDVLGGDLDERGLRALSALLRVRHAIDDEIAALIGTTPTPGGPGKGRESTRRVPAAIASSAETLLDQAAWRERAGRPRAGSAARRLIALLPALPVLSTPTARAAIGVSQQQTLAALKALAEAGVIRQLSAGSCHRRFAATELFELLTTYEEGVVGPGRSAR
jgi:hypothetical protein